MTRVQLAALLACLSAFGCDPSQPAALSAPVAAVSGPLEVTLAPSADTYIREWAPNQNQGNEPTLRLQNVGNNRALLQWDAQAVSQGVGAGTLTGARIELTITDNGNNWGARGRTIGLHPLSQAWSEGRATWNCASDADPGNHRPDCPGTTAWDMDHPAAGPFALTATASQTIRNGQTGTVAFDVTADVQAMAGGAGAKFGWILKKADETLSGRVEFGSRESGVPPRLVLTVAPGPVGGPQLLLTLADTGVTTTTNRLVDTLPKGTVVPYWFAAQPGFGNVQVQLDGAPVKPSGSVTMDTTHVLVASADRIYALPPGTEGLFASAQGLLTSADPVAAFQAHVNQIAEYVASTPVTQVEAGLNSVYRLAFNEGRDSAALDRLDDALGGHVFDVPVVGVSTALSFRAAAVPGDSAEPTTYLYINGIWTEQFRTATAASKLLAMIRSLAELNTPRFHLRIFYNRTRTSQPLSPNAKRGLCVYLSYERLRSESVVGYKTLFDQCMAGDQFGTEDDLVEAIRQWFDVHFRPLHFEEDAARLAAVIREFRGEGSHVILVPHSQGNLMAQQAMNILDTASALFPDSTFIGAVALASPSSEGWLLDDHHLLPVTLRGDLIPDAGLNAWPRIDSPLSSQRDVLLTALNLDPTGVVSTLLSPVIRGYYGIRLHSVDRAYLGQPAVYDTIQNDLVQLYREATVGQVQCALTGVQFFPGRGRELAPFVTVLNRNGRPLLRRSFEWSSSTPSVALVSATGRFTAVSPGVATITARSWQSSCEMAFEVVPPPDLSGDWTGNWQRTSAGIAASGIVNLTLGQSGTAFSGTVSYTLGDATYSSAVSGSLTSPIGATPVVELSMLSPEYTVPLPDYSFRISLKRTGATLTGSGTVNYHGIPNGEARSWNLQKVVTQ